MWLSILILSFAACEFIPDSIEPVNEDVVLDSSGVDSDSTKNDEDTTGTQDPGNTIDISGLFYTPAELAVWRTRAEVGPYKTKSDFVINSPDEWNRMVSFKNDFMNNPGQSLIKKPFGEFHDKHHKILAAAFVALVKDNPTIAEQVKKQLFAQRNQVTAADFNFTKHHGFHEANWITRLLFSYDYIKHYLTVEERQQLEKWFLDFAIYFKNNVHDALRNYFPNRLAGDYSVRGGVANTGGYTNGEYAFIDENGKPKNQIYWIGHEYNNRIASKAKYATLTGIMLDNQELIKHGKVFFKEMIMFGVFPDGTMAEYERNGDYGAPQTGAMYYGSLNIETLINIAEALRRKGDNSMYQYKTSSGLWSTQGGPKDLRLMIKAYMENMTGRVKRYYKSVQQSNMIDYEDEADANRHIVFEIMFSMANKYYQDPQLRSEYLRLSNAMPKYKGKGYWHAVAAWWSFSGPTACFPSYAFMYADMESTN